MIELLYFPGKSPGIRPNDYDSNRLTHRQGDFPRWYCHTRVYMECPVLGLIYVRIRLSTTPRYLSLAWLLLESSSIKAAGIARLSINTIGAPFLLNPHLIHDVAKGY